MADSENNKLPEEIVKSAKQLEIEEINWRRNPSQTDIEYLLDHCPFLQMVDTSDHPTILPEVKTIEAESGWNILFYGDAMSSSPGLLLLGGGDFRIKLSTQLEEDDEDGSGGDIINPGKGTFRNQAFMTAKEMVEIAKKMGWKSIRIIDGHRLMKWAAWSAGKDQSISIHGFTPDRKEEEKYKRLKRSRSELEMVTGYSPRM